MCLGVAREAPGPLPGLHISEFRWEEIVFVNNLFYELPYHHAFCFIKKVIENI